MFKTMKRIIQWTGERKKRLYWGFLWSFLHSMFTAMPIFGAAWVLNLMVRDSRGEGKLTPVYALYVLLFMITAILGRFLFGYLRATFQESIAYEKSAEERMIIGDILKRVSLGFFDKNNTGEINGSVTTDLSVLEMYSMKMTDVLVGGYINAAAMILSLAFFCWQAALIALAGIAGSSFFIHLLSKSSHKNAIVHQAAQNTLITTVIEYIRGIAVVKAYGQEGVSSKGIRDAYRDHRNINIKIELDYVWANSMHQLCLKLASVIIVLVTALITLKGGMPLPYFLVIAIFSFVVFLQVEQINHAAHTMELMETALNKIESIEHAEFIDEHAADQPLTACDVTFDNVSFGYDRQYVLKHVSFHIPAGSTTAIIGPSGCGKTTVCNLLTRFYDVNEGSVTIGDKDIRTLTCDSLLRNISMVFQNVYLFHDTILNNIRFGRSEATMEEVIEAAKKACCHDFISGLPDGYDTLVGEGGSSLSGGEKQRISLARAILKDAPIIILDEATASVDPENEHLIQQAISALSTGKTMIVIAHRLATIENAQQILVLEQGNVVQRGTHEELMGQSGLYRRFIGVRERAEGWSISNVRV